MRVRDFLSFLQKGGLLKVSKLEVLRGKRVGIDAVHWLRGLLSCADPLAPATGSGCAVLGEILLQEVQQLQKAGITPVFVFQGIEPRGHRLFFQLPSEQLAEAWRALYAGQRDRAEELFSGYRGSVGYEEEELALQLLKEMGVEVLQAAYLATAQLAYMLETGAVYALVGPPSLLLFGAGHAITHLDCAGGVFYWANLHFLLECLKLSGEELVDCCLLAGTDYCQTFPYLNLAQFQQGGAGFSFGAAVDFIRQVPMELYLQQFPDAKMKSEHVDGYCIGKCLIAYPLVIKESGQVEPVVRLSPSSVAPRSPRLPKDLCKVVGVRLPAALYLLLAEGLLSKQLVAALAQGEWLDSYQPAVECVELSDLRHEIVHYRCRALGLVAVHLNEKFKTQPVMFARIGGDRSGGLAVGEGTEEETEAERFAPHIDEATCRRWQVDKDSVAAELRRQGTANVDLGFCLKWQAHAEAKDASLIDRSDGSAKVGLSLSSPTEALDRSSVQALALFYFLDAVAYFDNGSETVFGAALAEVPSDLQEHTLVALELLKFGILTGDPLEAPKGRSFPPGAYEGFEQNEDSTEVSSESLSFHRSCLLLQRVASLLPLQLVPRTNWRGRLSLDLAAYSSVVSGLRGALRQLSEACLARVLLSDCSLLKVLPSACHSPKSSWLPCFQSWGSCLGLVMNFFLEYKPPPSSLSGKGATGSGGTAAPGSFSGPPPSSAFGKSSSSSSSSSSSLSGESPGSGALVAFEAALRVEYPAAKDPLRDLCRAIRFWSALDKVVQRINGFLDATEVMRDMEKASQVLRRQVEVVQLRLHPEFPAEAVLEAR